MKKASARKDKAAPRLSQKMYQTICTPVVTEKATLGSQHGQVTFRVPLSADKGEVKRAVEALFKVKVTKVNTLIQKGKLKTFKGKRALRSDTKKAIVTLADGQTIDVAAAI